MAGDPLLLLVLATILCGLLGVGLSRSALATRLAITPKSARWLDIALLLGLGLLGVVESVRLYDVYNPLWVPWTLDHLDFLGHLAQAAVDSSVYSGGYRYYLFPWLGAGLAWLQQVPPYLAAIRVSLFCNGFLLPAAYLLGRQMAPRPVALAGALTLLHLPALLVGLGHPCEYPLNSLLQLWVLAAGVAALRSGRTRLFWLWGVGLALYLGATSKSLTTLLVALPLGLAALPFHRPRRALLAALGLLLPLAAMWGLYGALDHGPRPLEFNIFQVEQHYAQAEGVDLGPEDWGWARGTPPDEMGSWRPGHLEALAHLPATIRFMLNEPPGYPPLDTRVDGIQRGLEDALATHSLPILLLALLGAAAAARVGGAWPRRLLAVIYLLVLGLGTLLGAAKLPFSVKFFLPLLIVLPTGVLAGVALPFWLAFRGSRRGMDLPWWPLVLVAASLLVWGPWSGRAAQERLLAFDPQRTHLARFLSLRQRLESDDALDNVVVDLTKTGQAAALYLHQARVLTGQFSSGHPPIRIPPSPAAQQRFLVLCFALSPCQEDTWWTRVDVALRRDPRFERLGQGLYQDLRPAEEVVLLPDYRASNGGP